MFSATTAHIAKKMKHGTHFSNGEEKEFYEKIVKLKSYLRCTDVQEIFAHFVNYKLPGNHAKTILDLQFRVREYINAPQREWSERKRIRVNFLIKNIVFIYSLKEIETLGKQLQLRQDLKEKFSSLIKSLKAHTALINDYLDDTQNQQGLVFKNYPQMWMVLSNEEIDSFLSEIGNCVFLLGSIQASFVMNNELKAYEATAVQAMQGLGSPHPQKTLESQSPSMQPHSIDMDPPVTAEARIEVQATRRL